MEELILYLGSTPGSLGNAACARGSPGFVKIRLSGLLLLPLQSLKIKLQAVAWHAGLGASELRSLQESVAAGCGPHANLPGCLPRRKCKLSSNDGVSERSQGARVFSKDSIRAESLGVPAALLPLDLCRLEWVTFLLS